ncbi:MAG: hypothetical protein P1U58_13430 [Verrucomicrobiales bacterium]|nr:hypothetical protein [Verrucomicrobiales bacterium]
MTSIEIDDSPNSSSNKDRYRQFAFHRFDHGNIIGVFLNVIAAIGSARVGDPTSDPDAYLQAQTTRLASPRLTRGSNNFQSSTSPINPHKRTIIAPGFLDGALKDLIRNLREGRARMYSPKNSAGPVEKFAFHYIMKITIIAYKLLANAGDSFKAASAMQKIGLLANIESYREFQTRERSSRLPSTE